MALKDLGPKPSSGKDIATVSFVQSMFPGHNTYIATDQDLVIPLPTAPVDIQMELFEVKALSTIQVTVPEAVILTAGLAYNVAVQRNKTAFFGFRYSAHSGVWFLLSVGLQQ